MLREHEVYDCVQWLWTNFLALPAIMLTLVMLTAGFGMIVLATQEQRWRDPETHANFVFLAVLEMTVGWMLCLAAGNAMMDHPWTPGNVAFILAPAILTAAIFIAAYRRYETRQKTSA